MARPGQDEASENMRKTCISMDSIAYYDTCISMSRVQPNNPNSIQPNQVVTSYKNLNKKQRIQ
jgi:hypothetical protein